MVLVNASSAAASPYNFGSSVYHEDNGNRWTGTISIPPLTGLMLHNGEPSVVIVAY